MSIARWPTTRKKRGHKHGYFTFNRFKTSEKKFQQLVYQDYIRF